MVCELWEICKNINTKRFFTFSYSWFRYPLLNLSAIVGGSSISTHLFTHSLTTHCGHCDRATSRHSLIIHWMVCREFISGQRYPQKNHLKMHRTRFNSLANAQPDESPPPMAVSEKLGLLELRVELVARVLDKTLLPCFALHAPNSQPRAARIRCDDVLQVYAIDVKLGWNCEPRRILPKGQNYSLNLFSFSLALYG